MTFDFNKYIETKNISPINIENKSKYYVEIDNIEDSTTGRIDAQICNYFITESIQLVVNSIALFEKGYFDSAYYSLRQSLEVATTMVYLVEISPKERKVELEKWKQQSKFPMYSQMLNLLNKKSNIFKEISECMFDYFTELKSIKSQIDKYVHKQGFNTFYIFRQSPSVVEYDESKFTSEFEFYLKKVIGAIAVFRLFIDPFPILLTDREIYYRTGDLLTAPYGNDFIEEFIGSEHVEKYKSSEFYQSYYDSIMMQEKQLPAVNNVIKEQFIDTSKIDEILSQRHLLSNFDLVAVLLCSISNTICHIHCLNGLLFYFTDIHSTRRIGSFNTATLKKFAKERERFNHNYDEAYISVLNISGENFYIEHNEKLSSEHIYFYNDLMEKLSEKIKFSS